MNRKSIFSCIALLLTASCLTACSNTSQKVVFSSNWQNDNIVSINDLTDTLEYDITFEKSSAVGEYQIDYKNGKYTAVLKTEQLGDRTIYAYETTLTIDVTYEYDQESVFFSDRVYSLVKFEKADKSLRPISSHKEVISHSPEKSAQSLDACYRTLDYVVDVTYNEDYSGSSTLALKNGDTTDESQNSFQMDTDKFTCLDNEQLLFALRGVNPSLTTSPKFNVYNPAIKMTQLVNGTFSAETAADFTFARNGETKQRTISYFPVSIVLNGKNAGATQKVWVAKNTNIQNNTYRNVILKMEMPVYYSLGTLVYTLKSATFSN